MLRGCVVAVAVVLTANGAAAAQTRPDFSGAWTVQPAPSDGQRGGGRGATGRGGRGGAAPDMGSGWGSSLTITQNANRLIVQYAFFTRGDLQPPLRFSYALDGSATTNTVMMGRGIQEETSRAAWDGDRLVITTQHPFRDPATGSPMTAEVKRILSLDAGGTLVVESRIGGVLGGPPTTTRTEYRRS